MKTFVEHVESVTNLVTSLQVFPIVIFFSSVISIMYYWGLMQLVVCRIAWLMQFTMGTTAIESLNAATNIFIGMVRNFPKPNHVYDIQSF